MSSLKFNLSKHLCAIALSDTVSMTNKKKNASDASVTLTIQFDKLTYFSIQYYNIPT